MSLEKLDESQVFILTRKHKRILHLLVLALAALPPPALAKQTDCRAFSNQTIVITGASSGFGKGVALKLAAGGANVVLAARRKNLLDDLASQCGPQALAVQADVSNMAEVERIAQAAIERFGKIDVWINNAGVGAIGRFTDIPIADQDRVVQVDLVGTLHGSYCALREFRRQGRGTLINIASVAGKLPTPFYASYSASKSAVVCLDSALRAELKAEHIKSIKICTVNPIFEDTPFFVHAANYSGHQPNPKPIYKAELAIDAIVKLVNKPTNEVNVGLASKLIVAAHKLAPACVERFAGSSIMHHQMEEPPPAKSTSGSLFQPTTDGSSVDGGIREQQKLYK